MLFSSFFSPLVISSFLSLAVFVFYAIFTNLLYASTILFRYSSKSDFNNPLSITESSKSYDTTELSWGKPWEMVTDREAWPDAVHGVTGGKTKGEAASNSQEHPKRVTHLQTEKKRGKMRSNGSHERGKDSSQ